MPRRMIAQSQNKIRVHVPITLQNVQLNELEVFQTPGVVRVALEQCRLRVQPQSSVHGSLHIVHR